MSTYRKVCSYVLLLKAVQIFGYQIELLFQGIIFLQCYVLVYYGFAYQIRMASRQKLKKNYFCL